ncbi:MAG: nucleoside triphosphate pyrophosphohydrolase, partial [Desulfoplanes sp.]
EYARRNNLKANTCLSTANNKFLSRFEKLEDLAVEKGLDISEMSLQEMDVLWDEVKQKEK